MGNCRVIWSGLSFPLQERVPCCSDLDMGREPLGKAGVTKAFEGKVVIAAIYDIAFRAIACNLSNWPDWVKVRVELKTVEQ